MWMVRGKEGVAGRAAHTQFETCNEIRARTGLLFEYTHSCCEGRRRIEGGIFPLNDNRSICIAPPEQSITLY